MKSLKTILACALLAISSSAFAQGYSMTFPTDVEIEVGKTAEVNVTFTSETTPAGWNMYLYLPTGIEIPYDAEEEEWGVQLSNLHKKAHSCDVKIGEGEYAGATILIMSAGTSTVEMKGNSGDLCTITLKATDAFTTSGKAEVKLIRFSDKDGKAYTAEDTSFTITLKNATGISTIENAEQNDGAVYNLAGQKVNNAQKGVFIQNGKKYVAK